MGKIYPKGSEVIASRDLKISFPENEITRINRTMNKRNPVNIATSGQEGFLTEDFRQGDTYASIKWNGYDYKDLLFEYGKDFSFTE